MVGVDADLFLEKSIVGWWLICSGVNLHNEVHY
jgi:hypothetical protein